MKPQGPKRRWWERVKRRRDRLVRLIVQFNADLASAKQNNPACANLPVKPHPLPAELPPMPEWSE